MQKFSISKNDYKKILESSVPVQDRPSFPNIKVKWILPILQSKVEENENLNFRLTLVQKNAILYTEQARDGTPHPKEEENYIDVFWKKTREHNHKDNFRQQRGEKRVELYQDLVLNHFVLRNSDWYARLKSLTDSINLTMSNDHLNGYIESIRDTAFYEMILLSLKQLECIKSVPEDERILYVDATGGLVKIPKSCTSMDRVDYKHILHYFCLMNSLSKIGSTEEL
ncbi:unnamed protein product [Brachionus calyciflorus]|uniref:Uncharacterized protein n=1 Tax=Brachionus calyciflorus TaxID=104777 RepID=A0A814B0Z2_9BILA|nr:unnamed protein product [Brachionus calyciflorus]